MLILVNSRLRTHGISGLLWNGVMDLAEIRRRNLDVLAAEAEGLEAIAKAVRRSKKDVDPESASKNYANYLSQIRIGTRKMGHVTARNLEEAMDKPSGWMNERQFDLTEAEIEAKEAAEIIRNMEPERRAHHMRMLRLDNENTQQRSAINPFGPVKREGPPRGPGTQ